MPIRRILFSLFALWPLLAFATDIKIIDSQGLIRAAVRDGGSVTVRLQIPADQPQPAKMTLTNIDGLLPDISVSSKSQGTFEFANVGEGTWQIKTPNAEYRVSDVRIIK
jgi:hypothetical protein